MRKNKIVSIMLASLISIFGLVGCNSSTSASNTSASSNSTSGVSTHELRIATQPSPFAASVFVAKEKGFLADELKKYNVKVTWTSFEAGPPMNEAFAAGQEDIGVMGDVPTILAKASGQKTIIIAGASYGEKTLALVVKPNSSIKDGKDLKGKKVAFVKGSYGHHLLGLILSKAGLSFNDIQSVNLPVADISNAVAAGQVDAGVVWEPSLTKGVDNKQTKILIDGTGIKRNNVFYTASESFAKSNPKIIEAYIKALNKASDYIKSNPKEAAAAIQPDIKLPVDELAKLLPKYNFTPVIEGEDIKELKDVEKFCRDQNLSKASVNVDQFVDTEYLKNSGLIK